MPVVRRRTEHAVRLVVPKQRLHISIVEANAAATAAASSSGSRSGGANTVESSTGTNQGSPSDSTASWLEPSGLKGLPLSAKLRNQELLLGLRSLGMTLKGAKKLIKACHKNEAALGALEAERVKVAGGGDAAGGGAAPAGPSGGLAASGSSAATTSNGGPTLTQVGANAATSATTGTTGAASAAPAPKSLKVYSKLDNCADSAEWNSLLVWARGQRGPQWDEATGIWQVDRNSDVYFSTCDNPARGTAFDTTPDVPEDQVPGLVQPGDANASTGVSGAGAGAGAGAPAIGGAQPGPAKADEDEEMSSGGPSVLNRGGRPSRSTGAVVRDSP